MRRRFHRVTGQNGWCGPTALALVLGIDTDRIAGELATLRERGETADDIEGISMYDIREMLTAHGIDHERAYDGYRDGFRTFARFVREAETGATYILSITTDDPDMGHFVVLRDGVVADNFEVATTKGIPWRESDISGRRRVNRAVRIN